MRRKKTLLNATIIVLILIISTTCFNFTVEAEGGELYVDSSYSGISKGTAEKPYKTIEEAIANADEGDTIYIFGGLYQEYFEINKKVKLWGGIDEEETIIDTQFDRRYMVEITADEVTIENITFSDDDGSMTSPIGALLAIQSNNNIINNNRFFSFSASTFGIYVNPESDDNLLGNNIINNTKSAIYLDSSSNNDLANNQIQDSSEFGIYIANSGGNNRLYSNEIYNCPKGISIKFSENVNITYNTIESSKSYAIHVSGCKDGFIINNILSNGVGDGIYLDSEDFTIKNNTIANNVRGITIVGSGNLVENNTFRELSASGIFIQPGYISNIIYLNKFVDNSVSAKDQGNNQWDYQSRGNYWSDYNNIDRDGDGIGDVAYSKNGVVDNYPLGYFLKPPNKASDPSPEDTETDVLLRITLKVKVTDPDSDYLDVYFYNGDDDTLIDSTQNPREHVRNNTITSCEFTLGFNRTFAWYVVVDDGLLQNTSDVFFFYTKSTPPDNDPPVADSGGPYEGEAEDPVLFNASGSYDSDGEIDFYRWNFGDGSSEIIDIQPSHIYRTDGEYTITLTVIDNDGSSSTDTNTVTIGPAVNDPPTAKASFPSTGVSGQTIPFSGSASVDPDGDELSFLWDFGDGTTSAVENPTHSYDSPGKYFVILKVSDGENSNTAVDEIVISSSPSGGIPGFELLLTIFALLIAFVIVKRRK